MKLLKLLQPLLLFLILFSNACAKEHGFSPSAVDIDVDADMDADGDGDSDSDGDTDGDGDSDAPFDGGVDTDNHTFDSDTITPDRCRLNTENEDRCLDCCDCMNSDCTLRASCREQCTTHNFINNTDFLVFDAPSDQGASGDYQACFLRGDRQACLTCCDCATIYACGDYKYCRLVCDQFF